MERMTPDYHQPVLGPETVRLLLTGPGIYIDGTLGGGGHSLLLLKALEQAGWLQASLLIGIDQDDDALQKAAGRLASFSSRTALVKGNFASIAPILAEEARKRGLPVAARAILLDLGVSSWQLDSAAKGFSFMKEGPLDMRMDAGAQLSAAELVNTAEERELASIIFRYGEEQKSRAVARAIVSRREQVGPFSTTRELAETVRSVAGGRDHLIKMQARVFQAIRIAVNRELDVLQEALEAGLASLEPGGRMGVISYHSLEDRIVKRYFSGQATPDWGPKGVGLREPLQPAAVKLVGRKPMVAGEEEIASNPRARSAKLRVVESLAQGGERAGKNDG